MTSSLRRIGLVAGREFMAAVANKGFVIGILLMPTLIAMMATGVPRVPSRRVPALRGGVPVIDPTGQVAGPLRAALTPAAISARWLEGAKRAFENTPAVVRDAATGSPAIERAVGTAPDLHIIERPVSGDLQQEKQWLTSSPIGGPRHL